MYIMRLCRKRLGVTGYEKIVYLNGHQAVMIINHKNYLGLRRILKEHFYKTETFLLFTYFSDFFFPILYLYK